MAGYTIIHFQPIEKYPPASNFIRLLAAGSSLQNKVRLITTDPGNGTLKIDIPGVQIHRVAKLRTAMSRASRMILYIRFLISSILLLSWQRPSTLLYYETLSAGAPLIYKRLLNPSCRLFIHYHEYTSPDEYTSGMILNRWLHRLELSLYKKASWVSHTNQDRMDLFLKDLGAYAPEHKFILPNHPPSAWARTEPVYRPGPEARIGFVYIGALSTETMFLKEMALYIAARPETCFWDIYSDNHSADVIQFLEQLNAENISFKGSVGYDTLPDLLPDYQIGLVLYKGHIPNYIYNIPNKLFEYYVCGLDTWFPIQMISSLSMVTHGTYPKVIPIDFERLDLVPFHDLTEREGYKKDKMEYAFEKTYMPLLRSFTANA